MGLNFQDVIRDVHNPATHSLNTSDSTDGLNLPTYDYVVISYDSATQETYTFKVGGSSGTTVATLVIVYTDSTKNDISTITKT